jgi:D-lactate dehydrogenase
VIEVTRHGLPAPLAGALTRAVPADRVLARPIDRVAFASDASVYRLIPTAVVLAASVDEVRELFGISRAHRVPLTFRAAGTSLSGQAVTDGLLVEVARHWTGITVEDGGARVRVQPGAIGGRVNARLAPFAARIGPDPASIGTCTIGGILANNSSGMCCGVVQNAYHTIASLTFVLPSGTVIDTAAPDADERFRTREPALAEGLLALRREILDRPALRDRIRAKYRTKNTNGYSLNALLDAERPVDIMRQLLIGSEGTLAFIAEAVLRTVPELPVRYTGMLFFAGLHPACAAIAPLRDAGAVALELMDRAALRSVQDEPGVPAALRTLPDGAAGLLVEFQARDEGDRAGLTALAADTAAPLPLLHPPIFTHDATEQARLWHVRKGMFPSVGATRRSGTTVIIEDVAFPVPALADAATDLTHLFARHGYGDAIVFGHAKDGNLHFVLTPSFNTGAAVDQYARFMDDLAHLVVHRYDGALKAEHGTGRNMAPFVETEWGPEAVAIMGRVKALCDPDHLLNPGVILNPDPRAHVAHLKTLPPVEPEVDRCIECGYCEPVCPSRDLTLTPRQRIVVRREVARRRAAGEDDGVLAELERAYPYSGVDTCAVDGLCATRCPVHIDTGELEKRYRREAQSPLAGGVANWCATHFDLVEAGLRMGLRAGHLAETLAGDAALRGVTRGLRRLGVTVPQWTPDMPRAARGWSAVREEIAPFITDAAHAAAVYYPTCLTRTLGADLTTTGPGEARGGSPALPLTRLAARAGRPVFVPMDAPGTCCGVPFSSKGYTEAHAIAVNALVERVWIWSDAGRLPVVIDTSPCAYGLRTCRPALTAANRDVYDRLRLLDSIEFVHDVLLPRLAPVPLARRVALHPVCSVVKLGLDARLAAIARACAREVLVPEEASCCGFAGDRGFLVPELTASATRREAAEVRARGCDRHYSSSRTCELALARATGRPYQSYLWLLDEAVSAPR